MAAPEVRGTLLSFARPPGCFAGLLLGELDSALYRKYAGAKVGPLEELRYVCLTVRYALSSAAVLSTRNRVESKCSRFEIESRALALDSKSNREHWLSNGNEPMASALDSIAIREPALSTRCCIESACSRNEIGSRAPASASAPLAQHRKSASRAAAHDARGAVA